MKRGNVDNYSLCQGNKHKPAQSWANQTYAPLLLSPPLCTLSQPSGLSVAVIPQTLSCLLAFALIHPSALRFLPNTHTAHAPSPHQPFPQCHFLSEAPCHLQSKIAILPPAPPALSVPFSALFFFPVLIMNIYSTFFLSISLLAHKFHEGRSCTTFF